MAGSFLRQSTASQSRATPPFLDDTDFKTAETGLTIANTDVKLIVNGGASADKNSGGGTHRANGVYGLTFDATDTATVGEMEVSIKVAGALPVFMKFWVLEEAVYDALFASSAPGYLQPTTAGRTLDVSAGGEAGLDWANIGSPTTAVTLSGTTVKTATDVETDTADIQSRLPAALVSGRIDASVGAYQSGLTPLQPTTAGRTLDVTAGGCAGIDWGNVENQSSAVDLSTTTVFLGTDAINSSSVAASATNEISSAVWSFTPRTLTAATNLGLPTNFSSLVISAGGVVSADAVAISGDTTAADNLEAALDGTGGVTITAGLTGNITGNLSGSVGSLAAQAKADVNAEVDTALSDVGLTTTITGRIDAAISTRLATASYTAAPSAAIVASQVRTELTAELAEVLKIPRSGQTYRHTNQDTSATADVTIGPAS